jgi:hypothetical protein
VDLSKLTQSDKVVAGSGILLFIASFLPWFKIDIFGGSHTLSGWDNFLLGGLPALLGLAAAAVILATKMGTAEAPTLPVSWGQAFLGAGGLSALLVVVRLLTGEDFYDRSWGLFVATIAALAFAGGGYLKFQEEKSGSSSI